VCLPGRSRVHLSDVQNLSEWRRHASCHVGLRLLFTGVSARIAARSYMHPLCTASSDVLQALLFVAVWVVLCARAGRIAPPLHLARPNRSSLSGHELLLTTSSLKDGHYTSDAPVGLPLLVPRHRHQCFKEQEVVPVLRLHRA